MYEPLYLHQLKDLKHYLLGNKIPLELRARMRILFENLEHDKQSKLRQGG
jgi:hypothetical protein